MQQLSDRELVTEILTGREDALGGLFDRYGSLLYDFIFRIVGDGDQAVRLLEEIFNHLPSLLPELGHPDLVKGWLYTLARETSLTFLRKNGWLNALPFSEEPIVSGLMGEIERAARAMPAFHRAVLVVEELHGLSPSEKTLALNVHRTDLAGIVDDARRSFKVAFDSQPFKTGTPLSDLAELERILGARRRIGTKGSLFGFVPPVLLPDSLAAKIKSNLARPRSQAVELYITPEESKLVTVLPPPETLAEPQTTVEEPEPTEPEPEAATPIIEARVRTSRLSERQVALIIAATLMLAFVITAIAPGIGYLVSRDTTPPVVTRIEPADGSTLPVGSTVIVTATFNDEHTIVPKTIRLNVDGNDVTSQATISEAALSYSFNPNPGLHNILLELRDNSDNRTARTWQFQILPPPTETATATPTATPTPSVTPTFLPTPTATGTLPVAPAITNFSANQTTVPRGASVLLSWTVTSASQVFFNQEKVDPTSSRLVTVDKTTTFQLTANNALGATTNSITVVVQELPDLIVNSISLNSANQILFTVRNDGAGDVAKGFVVQVTANGIVVYSDRPVSSLPASQEARLSIPNYTVVGTQSVSVRVNVIRDVEESNYNNNELVRTLSGATPTTIPSLSPTTTPTLIPTNTPVATNTSVVSFGCISGTTQDNAGRTLPGWTINLDWVENGIAQRRSTFTDANGFYKFENLTAGLSYSLNEVLEPDWIALVPTLWTIGVAPSTQCSNIVFVNQLPTPVPTATSVPTNNPTQTTVPSITPTQTRVPSITPTQTRVPSITPTPTSNCITGIKADEHGDHLPYWTMVLDFVDENGITRHFSTVTDRNGWFWFPDLKKGLTYMVSEVMQPGWEAVYPTSFVVVLDGCPELIFKNRFVRFAATSTPTKTLSASPTSTPVLGCITGIKSDESGTHLSGWTILLDWTDERNVVYHLGTVTDSNGWFGFAGLKAGLTYTVSEVPQTGWESIFPTTYVIVLNGCPELVFKNRLVRTATPTPTSTPAPSLPVGCITGTKQDTNGSFLPGWTINLDWVEGGVSKRQSMATNSSGAYKFVNLTTGLSYTVSETLQPGWTSILPTSWTIAVTPSDKNFTQCQFAVFVNQSPSTPTPTR